MISHLKPGKLASAASEVLEFAGKELGPIACDLPNPAWYPDSYWHAASNAYRAQEICVFISWQHPSILANGRTKENVAEAGTGTAKETDAVPFPRPAKTLIGATEVAAENGSAASVNQVQTEANLLTLLLGRLRGGALRTVAQVNQTGMHSEAASTPDLTVGT